MRVMGHGSRGKETFLKPLSLSARVVADATAIWIGAHFGRRLPQRTVSYVATGLFVLFGILPKLEALTCASV